MSDSNSAGSRRSRWPWVIGLVCLLLVLMALVLRRDGHGISRIGDSTNDATPAANLGSSRGDEARRLGLRGKPGRTAQEIVSSKVVQFAQSRREFVRALARRAKKDVPNEVEEFFDALERGNW